MNNKSKEEDNEPETSCSGHVEPVVMLQDYMKQDKFSVAYVFDGNNKIIGVSHPEWPFRIMRNRDNKTQTAIVCSNTDEPFGILDSDVFNTVLMCWLLIDDPKLIDDAAQDAT